jgi:very-short-patch-repair endonuclease
MYEWGWDESSESDPGGPDLWTRSPDERIAAVAAGQEGLVSWRQLRNAGLSPKAIRGRLASRRLHLIHQKVFAVGHDRLTLDARYRAAVLAADREAVVSHESAAALWGIRSSSSRVVHVTTSVWTRDQPGIRFHTMKADYDERTKVRGIPVTGPSRTLLDLGQVLDNDALERALREAERLQLTDVVSVADLLERYPRRRGCAAVRRLTAMKELYKGVTRSELEERFRQFLRANEIPDPEWNVRVDVDEATFEVDCLWRSQQLVVELDGYGYHAGLDAFERDRLRDRLLQLAGFVPIRITWRALRDDPGLAAELRQLTSDGP